MQLNISLVTTQTTRLLFTGNSSQPNLRMTLQNGPYVTHLLTPWNRVLLEKLRGSQIVKKFPAVYGTRRFITAFTSAHYLSISWASSIQSIPPHHTSWRSIFILSSHLSMGLPSCLFPSGFFTKTLYTPLLSPIRATWPYINKTKNSAVYE